MTQNEFNPYVGPRPFERIKEDSARFFGRTEETAEIVSLIFGHPVILVYAQSGAGKTSLFNASVAPKLEENGFEVLPLTRVGGIVPKGISLKEIENLYVFNALLKIDSETSPQTLVSKSLPTFLKTRPRMTDENGQPRPRVVIFDQFEELFTYTPENWREQREGFFQQVVEALNADPLLRVVFVIREDFLAELDPYARILPERLRTRYRLERLGETAAMRAIKDPLANTTRKFAPGVAKELVRELLAMRTVDATGKTAEIKGQYIEPVQLQVVCVTLWSTLEPDVTEIQQIHLKDFNVNDALSNFYRSAVESAAKETGVLETTLRNWFGRTLITSMGTRSTVFRGETTTGGIENSAVDFLESRHIIRAEFRAGARWYELTHDRLVEPIIQNNQDWYKTNLSLFQRQAELWIQQGRSKGLLLSGEELAQAEEEAKKLFLTLEEKEFLDECREQQELTRNKLEQEARERRRLRQFLAIAGSLLVLAIIAAIFAFSQSIIAKNNANAAQRSANAAVNSANEAATAQVYAQNKQATAESAQATAQASEQKALDAANSALAGKLAAEADSQKDRNYALALFLSTKAYKLEETTLTRTTLFDLLQFTPYIRLFGLNDPESGFAVSPNGKIIASSKCREYTDGYDCAFGDIILTNAETHQLIRKIPGVYGYVKSLAFTKQGDKLILAAGGCVPYYYSFRGCSDWGDGQISFWDVTKPAEKEPLLIKTLELENVSFDKITFSHNGLWMASIASYNTIFLWDVRDPAKLNVKANIQQSYNSYDGLVNSFAFSSDDNTLVSVGGANVRFWNISHPERFVEIDVHPFKKLPEESIYSVAFSSDGTKFASTNDDNSVMLWDWDNATQKLAAARVLHGHNGKVYDLTFNADGTVLASAGADSKVILWDTTTGNQIGLPLSGHTNAINAIAFGSPDLGSSLFLFSNGSDQMIIQWDLSNHHPLGESITETEPPKENNVDANSENFVAKVENEQQILLNGQALQNAHTGIVNSLQFGSLQDGTLLLASASDDQTVILWNVAHIDTEPIFLKLDGFENPVRMAYFENGQLITVEKNSERFIRWDIDPSTWVPRVCENIHLTDSQIKLWETLTGDKDYQSVCQASK